MKTQILTIFFLASVLAAFGQTPRVISLEEALSLGQTNNLDLKNQALQVELAQRERNKIEARRSPIINATGDLRSNVVLPTTIIPAGAFGGGSGEDQKLRFGTTFNITGAVSASYALIDPTLRTDQLRAEGQKVLQEATLEKQKANYRLTIAEAWYDVFLKQEQLKLAEDKLKRAESLLQINQNRVNAGALLSSELQRSQLEVDNSRATRDQAKNSLDLSRQNLAYRVGLPLDALLEVGAILAPNSNELLPAATAMGQRWELKEEQQREVINLLDQQRTKELYRPNLNLIANGQIQHLSNNFAIWEKWFPAVYVGLQTNFTLFDGNLKRKNLEILQLQNQVSTQTVQRIQQDINYEMASTQTALKNTIVQWQSAQQNLNTARKILDLDKERYNGGNLLYADVLNTEFSLREAENNSLSAWYNYLVAKIRWEKAMGR
jgi:outer membrane protein TolC